jgi:hypothetical protein
MSACSVWTRPLRSNEANLNEQCLFSAYLQRLAILYRKRRQPDQERRVVLAAIDFLPEAHRAWFVARLKKLPSA